jgi:hypothetical protein
MTLLLGGLGENSRKSNDNDNSRSPFDFAQGRLFGMTTKKAK